MLPGEQSGWRMLPFYTFVNVNSKSVVNLFQKTYCYGVLCSAEAGVYGDGYWKIWFSSFTSCKLLTKEKWKKMHVRVSEVLPVG